MIFTPAPQNGITPASTTGTIQSNFILIASSTATSYGKPVVLKAISNAAVYKENPVTFYSLWNNGSTTTTITLGTSSFINVSSCPFVLKTLQTGTHNIYAVWPGQGRFAGQTSIYNSTATVSVASGANLGGTFNIISSVPSGTAIAGETPVTFEAILSTSTFVTGSFVFYEDHTQLGSVTIFENAGFLTVPYLDPGTHLIEAVWAGRDINGTLYEGVSTSTSYTVLAGRDSHAGLNLAFTPSYGVYREGNIQMVATLTTSTNLPGNISFYDDANVLLGSVPVVNNQADFTIFNNLTTGTYTYTATWDGNQTSTPRYLSLTTSSNIEILARELPDTLYLTINPNPTSYMVNTVFTAYFTATTSAVYTGTVVFFDGNVPIGSSTLTNNQAVFQTTSLAPGNYNISAYYPGSLGTPKYYSTSSQAIGMTVTTGLSFSTPMALTITNDNYLGLNQFVAGYPTYFTLDLNTSTNLSGQTTYIVQNYQSLTTGTFTFNGYDNYSNMEYTYSTPGTQSVYGLWYGGLEEGKFYASQRTNPASVFTITNGYVIGQPLNIDVINDPYGGIHGPYIVNETQTIKANITGTNYFKGEVDFYVNGSEIGTATFINSVAELPTLFASSGTYTVYANWLGGTDTNGRPFIGKTSALFTITAISAYTLGPAITLAPYKTLTSNLPGYLSANVSTSSQMSNNINFYSNGTFIGTATFSSSTNQAILITNSSTFSSTGTYTISAHWLGGIIDGTRPYFNKQAVTATVNVIYAVSFPGRLTLSTNPSTTTPFTTETITVTASSGTNLSGTITLTDTIYDPNPYIWSGTTTTNKIICGWISSQFITGFLWDEITPGSTSTPFTVALGGGDHPPTVKIYSPDLNETSYYWVASITGSGYNGPNPPYFGENAYVSGVWYYSYIKWASVQLIPTTDNDVLYDLYSVYGIGNGAPYEPINPKWTPWHQALQRCIIETGSLISNSNYNHILAVNTVTTLALTTGSTSLVGLPATNISGLNSNTIHNLSASWPLGIFDGVRTYGTQTNTATLTISTGTIKLIATPPYTVVYNVNSNDSYLSGAYDTRSLASAYTATSFRATLSSTPSSPITLQLANFGTVISTATSVGNTVTFNFPANSFSTGTYAFTAIYPGATTYISNILGYRIY